MTLREFAERFPGSKSSRDNLVYLLLCAVLSAVVGGGLYYSNLNWFVAHKTEEKVTVLGLVDAFVNNYSKIRSELGDRAPVPSTFRAHSIDAFGQTLGGDEVFRLRWVGRPGRQIRVAPSDAAMAKTIEAFAAAPDPKAKSEFLSVGGQVVFRTVFPSYARDESCVACHNRLQPGADWRFDDLMGGFVIDTPASPFLRSIRLESTGLGLGLFVTLAAFGFVVSRQHAAQMAEREAAAAEVSRARAFLDTVVENIPAVVTVRNAGDDKYVLVNRSAAELVGLPREALLGRRPRDVLPAEFVDSFRMDDRSASGTGEVGSLGEHEIRFADKPSRFLSTRSLVIDEAGEPKYLLSLSEDITERKRAEARVAYMARHDPLTELPNRAAFLETLAQNLEHARAQGESFALIAVDVDRFKEINDQFGASVGDALLRTIAKRLASAAGGAPLARVGGDEFSLLASGGPRAATAEALAERLHAALAREIDADGHRLRASVSVGIAIYPTDGEDANALIANANAALHRAKAEGSGRASFFDVGMDTRLRERRGLLNDLRCAAANAELALHYQPQALMTGEFVGMEALLRWRHPTRGTVSPAEFIPLAEESGLIIPIGEWVLREACREAASWSRPLRIGVNISPIQFRNGDLPSLVLGVLRETGLAPDRLELEITEGVLVDDFASAFAVLQRLKALGVRIAMDDFGTGYSSLSYLQAFPFDKIKIDQSFIAKLGVNPQSDAIVRGVIGMARGLKMPVLAEGVETGGQLAFLTREFCDEAQGYYLGKPGPIAQYARELRGVARELEPALA